MCRHVLVYRLHKTSLIVPFLDNGQIMKADQIYKKTSFHRKQNIRFFKKITNGLTAITKLECMKNISKVVNLEKKIQMLQIIMSATVP